MNAEQAILKIDNLHVYYGGIHALKGISLEVNKNKIVSLIGANGAGKSTTLRTISGLIRSKTGTIKLRENFITELPAHRIVEMGVAMVPEGRKIFPNLTVMENLSWGVMLGKMWFRLKRTWSGFFPSFLA